MNINFFKATTVLCGISLAMIASASNELEKSKELSNKEGTISIVKTHEREIEKELGSGVELEKERSTELSVQKGENTVEISKETEAEKELRGGVELSMEKSAYVADNDGNYKNLEISKDSNGGNVTITSGDANSSKSITKNDEGEVSAAINKTSSTGANITIERYNSSNIAITKTTRTGGQRSIDSSSGEINVTTGTGREVSSVRPSRTIR